MICATIEEFAAALPAEGAVIGLDPGTKTIGVALSDRRRRIATPSCVIRRRKPSADMEALVSLIETRAACGAVLGLPLNMDGSEGPRAQSARAFARNLVARLPLPVFLWDERLSTVAAERALIEADASRKRRSEVIDAVAAGYILQGALDRLARIPPRQGTTDEQR